MTPAEPWVFAGLADAPPAARAAAWVGVVSLWAAALVVAV